MNETSPGCLHFFSGLRWKLIATYVAVTVLALLALEIVVLTAGFVISDLTHQDERAYLNDVVITLNPQARQYLQPGKEDLPGLQSWIESLLESGYASLEAQDMFDSPPAEISAGSSLYVLSTQKLVLAFAPMPGNAALGTPFEHPFPAADEMITAALTGDRRIQNLYTITPQGNYWMAVPVYREAQETDVVGVIVLTVNPPPPMFQQVLPSLVRAILITGILLLCAVVPFGALFGLIMSRGLTRRLNSLSQAADAWSQGDFRSIPADPVQDEIGLLSRRLRNMAEQIQILMQDQQTITQMEERNRLARDLHDTVKQQTFATLMQVRAARNQFQRHPQQAEQHLQEAENLIKASQQELSLMINELRPAVLEDQGLAAALETYLAHWSNQTCIPAKFESFGSVKLPITIEQTTLYRVAQEALSNVARHSRATQVMLRLNFQEDTVILEIEDNGVGFDVEDMPIKGYGLQSMRERLDVNQGVLNIKSQKGGGTIIVVEIKHPAIAGKEESV